MTRRKHCKKRSAITRATSSRGVGNDFERVMHELEAVARENLRQADPILEQLKQCPEAFKAGEMIGEMLDSLKYSQGNDPAGDRYLPPAGAVIPPLV